MMRYLEQHGYLTKSVSGDTRILQPEELVQRWVAGYIEVWRKFRSHGRWVRTELIWQDERQL